MLRITAKDNEKIKEYCAIRNGDSTINGVSYFVAEGLKLCTALSETCRVVRAFFTGEMLQKHPFVGALCEDCAVVSDTVAAKISDTKTPQGLWCVLETPYYPQHVLTTCSRVLVMDEVQDPGNVGTMIRSAAAFGFDAVVVGPGCAQPFGPKAIRASMGAAGSLPVVNVEDLPLTIQTMRENGFFCCAAALYNSIPLSDVECGEKKLCVVIGNEGRGIQQDVIKACNQSVRIPIHNKVESLNAAAAASVLLWHFGDKKDGC